MERLFQKGARLGRAIFRANQGAELLRTGGRASGEQSLQGAADVTRVVLMGPEEFRHTQRLETARIIGLIKGEGARNGRHPRA